MGSLTVRKLGEDVKKRLRLRAAANGRSMEEEVRTAAGRSAPPMRPFAAGAERRRQDRHAGAAADAAARSCSSSAAASPPTNRST